jgi:hypothetical protein
MAVSIPLAVIPEVRNENENLEDRRLPSAVGDRSSFEAMAWRVEESCQKYQADCERRTSKSLRSKVSKKEVKSKGELELQQRKLLDAATALYEAVRILYEGDYDILARIMWQRVRYAKYGIEVPMKKDICERLSAIPHHRSRSESERHQWLLEHCDEPTSKCVKEYRSEWQSFLKTGKMMPRHAQERQAKILLNSAIALHPDMVDVLELSKDLHKREKDIIRLEKLVDSIQESVHSLREFCAREHIGIEDLLNKWRDARLLPPKHERVVQRDPSPEEELSGAELPGTTVQISTGGSS